VGRQAIFDRTGRTVGYELLYRDSMENRARFSDADAAAASTIINAYLEHGLDRLAGDLPVWVNLPAAFLTGELPVLLPPERVVLEVLESVKVTPAVIAGVSRLRASGYRIALDDFVLTPETAPLLDFAHVVKLDVLNVAPETIRAQLEAVRPHVATVVAEKVSTHAEHAFLLDLGFDLFQGYFLEMPIVERRERMPHDRATLVRLLMKLYDARASYQDIEKLLAAEVGLTLRLFKLAGSAALSRGAPIASVAQAVARLGTQQVAALVLLIVAASFDDKPLELVRKALVRAKMCEHLARFARAPADELFTAGLFTLLDAVLDQPLDTILAQLPVTDLIRDVLRGVPTGDGSRIVTAARAQDRGDFETISKTGFPAHAVFVAWYEAVRWTDDLVRALGPRG
jgi:EAL and modified HD-GYP domain-containing signal transduction protein